MNLVYRMFMYDFLYILGDALIKKHNPCGIQVFGPGSATCVQDLEWCCRGCRYIGPNGCTVACLGCKLNLCETTRPANLEVYIKLVNMLNIARYYQLSEIRSSRQEIYHELADKNSLRYARATRYI